MNCNCIVCSKKIELVKDTLVGELIECSSCGQEHEVIQLEPELKIDLAPEIEEDWGE